jgi:hypothetical protein
VILIAKMPCYSRSNTFDSFYTQPTNATLKTQDGRKEEAKDSHRLIGTSLLVAAIGQVVCADERILVVGHISAALETLHFPGLQLAEVLLACVDAADLVADDVGLDVLLRLGL